MVCTQQYFYFHVNPLYFLEHLEKVLRNKLHILLNINTHHLPEMCGKTVRTFAFGSMYRVFLLCFVLFNLTARSYFMSDFVD